MKPKFLWTKLIIRLLFVLLPFFAVAQKEVKTEKVTTPRIDLNGYRLDSVKNDTFNIANATRTVLTAKATYDLVKKNSGVKGDPGPTGPTGAVGPTGPTGTAGPTGKDGNKIFNGTSAPSSGLGDSAALYVRSNGDVFEKTTPTIWTYRYSIKGAQGDKGDPGTGVNILGSRTDSTLLPGSGNLGDAYLVQGKLWVWNGTVFINSGNIQGPAGVTGPTGPQGAPGATGGVGATGRPGVIWLAGTTAPSAGLGDTSTIYLNKINGDLYNKKTGSWVLEINIRGPQGAQGIAGSDGAPGMVGTAGAAGTKWLYGTTAPGSGFGDTTNLYINTTTGDVYEKTGLSTWTPRGNLKGPPGAGGAVSAGEYVTTASANQTAFTSTYALPAANEKITITRNGVILPFTKSVNTLTVIACDAGDAIKIKWVE